MSQLSSRDGHSRDHHLLPLTEEEMAVVLDLGKIHTETHLQDVQAEGVQVTDTIRTGLNHDHDRPCALVPSAVLDLREGETLVKKAHDNVAGEAPATTATVAVVIGAEAQSKVAAETGSTSAKPAPMTTANRDSESALARQRQYPKRISGKVQSA